MSQTESQPSTEPTLLVARASGEYRIKRYIMIAVIIGMGLYFGYDGWYGWPAENARIAELQERQRQTTDETELSTIAGELKGLKPHTDLDILIQKVLFFVLPPVGIAYLMWTLYNSRGRYRLENQQLSIPGHPVVDLDQITRIDKQLWDRKGIAYIDYDTGAQTGTMKLDDFVYQAKPTRDIFKRIETHTLARVAAAETES